MAGLGDGGRPKRRRASLIEEAAASTEARAPERTPEPSAPSEPKRKRKKKTGTPSVSMTVDTPTEKVGWYMSSDLVDQVRDAIEFLNDKGMRVDGKRLTGGLLAELALPALLDKLQSEHAEGEAFPESLATASARAKRARGR